MSKKDKKQVIGSPLTADSLEENSNNVTAETNQNALAPTSNKNKPAKNKGKVKNKGENGFVRFFKKIGRAFRGMVEELKKVTWPTFATTLKSTGVVLVFVVIFLVVLMAMDALFGLGFNSLINIGS